MDSNNAPINIKSLDYLAFLIVYIAGFCIMFQPNTLIIGFEVIFSIHFIFMLYLLKELSKYETSSMVLLFACFSIFVNCIFHFISLIFVFIMLTTMNAKFISATGSPIQLPEPYSSQLTDFQNRMIICFCAGFFVLFLSFNNYTKGVLEKAPGIDSLLRIFTDGIPFGYGYSFFLLSVISVMLTIASYQIYTANNFQLLTRQQLIPGKDPTHDTVTDKDHNAALVTAASLQTPTVETTPLTENVTILQDLSPYLPGFLPNTDNIPDRTEMVSIVYYLGSYYDRFPGGCTDLTIKDTLLNCSKFSSSAYPTLNPLYNWIIDNSCDNLTYDISFNDAYNTTLSGTSPARFKYIFESIVISKCVTNSDFTVTYNNVNPRANNINNCTLPTTVINLREPFSGNYSYLFDRRGGISGQYSNTFTVDAVKQYINAGIPLLWLAQPDSFVNFSDTTTNVWQTPTTFNNDAANLPSPCSLLIIGFFDCIAGFNLIIDQRNNNSNGPIELQITDGSKGAFKYLNQQARGDNVDYGYISYNYFFAFNSKAATRFFDKDDGPTNSLIYIEPSYQTNIFGPVNKNLPQSIVRTAQAPTPAPLPPPPPNQQRQHQHQQQEQQQQGQRSWQPQRWNGGR